MIDIDTVVDLLPETMTWEQVREILEAIVPSMKDMDEILGSFELHYQTIDLIIEKIQDHCTYMLEEFIKAEPNE